MPIAKVVGHEWHHTPLCWRHGIRKTKFSRASTANSRFDPDRNGSLLDLLSERAARNFSGHSTLGCPSVILHPALEFALEASDDIFLIGERRLPLAANFVEQAEHLIRSSVVPKCRFEVIQAERVGHALEVLFIAAKREVAKILLAASKHVLDFVEHRFPFPDCKAPPA